MWEHELDRTARFLRAMDIPAGDIRPELWLSDRDRAFGDQAVPAEDTLGVFIGAAHWSCLWPTEKWTELLNSQRSADRIALFGSGRESEQAADIAAGLDRRRLDVIDLTGKTTLRQLAACLGRCRLVVSTDSCGLHFATAQHVPTVGLLGGYHYGRFYPWGDERINRVARLPMECYYCNNKCIYEDFRCVSGIEVEAVLEEMRAIPDRDV
jgi:ADP-heptose:LPS heptosyltransferase